MPPDVTVAPSGALNPDAGDHPITGDARELAAAARASQRSLEEFPYYQLRYGERAARFGGSDGGWLAWLCSATPSFAREQIRWLGVVLASRGMPTLLLERHLRLMHEELVAAIPEKRASYRILLTAANELRAARAKVIDETTASRIADEFREVWSSHAPEMGRILVAAVADERSGIERAAASIEEWAVDGERFAVQWVEAVRATLAAARSLERTA